jgi:acetyl esterase/lipase
MIFTILTLVLFGASLLDPTSNLLTWASLEMWATFGPHLVLVSAIALFVGILGLWRHGPRRLFIIGTVVAVIALIISSVIVAQIVVAVSAGGGSSNPVSGLWLYSLSGYSPDAVATYTVVDGEALHAYIYEPSPSSNSSSVPVIMYIHGGGWVTGSPTDNSYDLRWFANHGWLVVSIEYTLANSSYATWNIVPNEVACALVWTSQNAARFGGDPSRIVVAGDSAGGNLAVNLAYSAALGVAQSDCGGTVPVPRAVVVQYPVVDPNNAYVNGFGPPGHGPKDFTSEYIGGTPEQYPNRIDAISSVSYLSSKAPQTLVIEPEDDGLIPSSGVYNFVNQAKAAGVNVTLVRIPWADHGYDQILSAYIGGLGGNTIGDQAHLTITENYLTRLALSP